MKVGDVIVEFDGRPVKDSTELPRLVARTAIGKTVPLTVIRDKGTQTLSVTVGELKDEETPEQGGQEEKFGLTVQPLTPEIAERLGLSARSRASWWRASSPAARPTMRVYDAVT